MSTEFSALDFWRPKVTLHGHKSGHDHNFAAPFSKLKVISLSTRGLQLLHIRHMESLLNGPCAIVGLCCHKLQCLAQTIKSPWTDDFI